MRRTLRIAFGLVAAAVTAGVILTLHVVTPMEIAGLSGQMEPERAWQVAELAALLSTQAALFVIPFGIILAIVTEINRLRGLTVYLLAGLAIAAGAFYLHYFGEGDLRTVVNPLAAQVFALQGAGAAFAYWLVSGRFAGWRSGGGPHRADPIPRDRPEPEISDAAEKTVTGAATRPA